MRRALALPIDEATVYNEFLQLLYLDNGSLKRASTAGKTDAVADAALRFEDKLDVISFAQGHGCTWPVRNRNENRPVQLRTDANERGLSVAHVIFYEKPGCGGNARQKALLVASGHSVEPRNLLKEQWSSAELRLYFGDQPIVQWFNQSSPRIKAREIDPDVLAESTALELMIADPLLIRRPLMRVGERREAGFDRDLIEAWIGLAAANGEMPENGCVRSGLSVG